MLHFVTSLNALARDSRRTGRHAWTAEGDLLWSGRWDSTRGMNIQKEETKLE